MIEVLPILGQPAAALEPGDSALEDPGLGEDDEAVGLIGAFDDFDVEPMQRPSRGVLELRPLITAIGIELEQEWEPAEQAAQQQCPAIAILNVGRMNDGVQQQTLRVYQKMALFPLDLLARVIPVRVNRGPPFSAALTLWLSMI